MTLRFTLRMLMLAPLALFTTIAQATEIRVVSTIGVKMALPEILAEVAKEPEFTVDADARAQGAQSATAKAAANRYFFIRALFLACPPRAPAASDGQCRRLAAAGGKGRPESLFSSGAVVAVGQLQPGAAPSRLE